ncbi:MAG: phosphoribosylformylglycinamidine synthase [Christensenellaceae bacterium]|jgi:phosphoribosylformylglycinamidine synthase|nr:phosphoribosylformylglycinamidine synthase [Christensenellaceae bacterium]
MAVKRIFVEKNEGFDIPAQKVLEDVVNVLKINASAVRLFNMYDIEGISDDDLKVAVENVFSEPPVDAVYYNKLPWLFGFKSFAVEYLDGQYDQRADSAEQCVQLLLNKDRPRVKTATVYAFKEVTEEQIETISKYLVNPTDSRICSMELQETLEKKFEDNDSIEKVEGFSDFFKPALKKFYQSRDFAMSLDDLIMVCDYFKTEQRDPTETELKVIDTYWSDHCRHTTFNTEITKVGLGKNKELIETYNLYRTMFKELYKDSQYEKQMSLMDIATIALKGLKREALFDDLDESEEINACSIKVKVKTDSGSEDWLVMFKNETHNHPTEIEPFGGAATCLGGAVRDPLSGRAYVYQAMRITGAADVYKDVKDTLNGKLPQRVISKTATAGFSSYGNQLGLATGIVREIYNDKYVAKRLETGFVIAAAPKKNVIRSKPQPGDKIILLGGETGRDGCGGATGSSKAHNIDSVLQCGAEVQKGNPLTERKIQRFFRNPDATRLIRRCNDFGAGGVAVAIGELADSLDIYLDLVPKKYKGLSVTETAISESQERMACVVDSSDVELFIKLAREENLDATVVANVTDSGRMRMFQKGEIVVDILREFLDTCGVKQKAEVQCRNFKSVGLFETYSDDVKEAIEAENGIAAIRAILAEKTVMLQKGLGETFDSTIGAGSVFMPFGGALQLTPSLCMAAKIPLEAGFTNTSTVCAWAFDADITDANPFIGSLYSTIASISKLVASGVYPGGIRLTLQEFFKRLNADQERFGEPFAALLGTFCAQYNLSTPAIGGKDSMSGSFEDLDVPNTLISFAVGTAEADRLITNVFKPGDELYILPIVSRKSDNLMPDFTLIKKLYLTLNKEIIMRNVTAATVVETGGAVAAIIKSIIGDNLGVTFQRLLKINFESLLGDIIIAVRDPSKFKRYNIEHIATVTDDGIISCEAFGEEKSDDDPLRAFLLPEMLEEEVIDPESLKMKTREAIEILSGHETLYPTTKQTEGEVETLDFAGFSAKKSSIMKHPVPRVLIPVFPGTNCEYDTAKRFREEGAEVEIVVIKNANSDDIKESAERLVKAIKKSQIIAFPGGFSGGDEPDGSGKFIAATFKNPYITDAIHAFLKKNDGLILGICNGFQALVKLGLLPYGSIKDATANSPTLTFNSINRHVSTMVKVRLTGNHSPWLSSFTPGQIFNVPVSHGEGRFMVNENVLAKLIRKGQIATQYVDFEGNATLESPFNPNGSNYAIEGLLSEDGRIFGKMGHCERIQPNLYINLPKGDNELYDMNVFANGIKYFS